MALSREDREEGKSSREGGSSDVQRTCETSSGDVRLESNVRVANGNTVRFRKHRGIADVNLKRVRIRRDRKTQTRRGEARCARVSYDLNPDLSQS